MTIESKSARRTAILRQKCLSKGFAELCTTRALRRALLTILFGFGPSPFAMAEPQSAAAAKAPDQQEYCSNIAASAESLRLERRRKELSELESQLTARLSTLEAKQNELRALLDRLDAFDKKSGETLIGLYSRMKPEVAAAQIAQLDDEIAASLIFALKTKTSSAILGEMEAGRGAALARKIAQLRASNEGKKP
jgi:flagellar motility protein MotE (MotC chaperone)